MPPYEATLEGTDQDQPHGLWSCQQQGLGGAWVGRTWGCVLPAHSDSGVLACVLQVKAGLGVNVIGLVIVMVAINTWGVSLFHLDTFPAWAQVSNITDQF